METIVAFLHIIFIGVFCWWYWRREVLPIRKFYWHALAAKLSAGILVGIVYAISYANSDTFFFFSWAMELSHQARVDFVGYLNYLWSQQDGYFLGADRTIFFVKITSVFALFTYDNYWISSLYFSLFSFFAAWRLTKIIWINIPDLGIPAAIAFLFFPSCVFWASGIIKESLAMTGLFYLTWLFLKVWLKQRISMLHILFAIIATWVVWNLKYYYIGLFVPALLTTWVTRRIVEARKIKQFSTEVAVWVLVLMITVFIISFAHPNFYFNRILDVLVANNTTSTLQSPSPDNVIHFYNLKATWLSLVINSPWALISGFYRPFIWEANTMLKIFVSVENLLLLVMTSMALLSLSRIKNSPNRLLILAILVYAVVLCVFLAISTPNFGTLVRYRIGFLPFLILLLVNQPFIVRSLSKLFNVHTDDLPR